MLQWARRRTSVCAGCLWGNAPLTSIFDITRMAKRFTIAFGVCIALFLVLNALRLLTSPPAKVGASGWRTIGVPFPVKVENVQYTATGPIVTGIKDQPWIWVGNVGLWLLVSHRFSCWVERRGAAGWRGQA
jgi:hypothetical protein